MPDNGTVYINPEEPKTSPRVEAQVEIKKLDKLASEANHVIYELSSVFPFHLFPDRIIIDENKVTIVRKEILFKREFPILYKDILSVKLNQGIIFAALEFEVRRFTKNPRPIDYLWPNEALLAKKYIMGMVEAKRAKIDFSKLKTGEIRQKLEEIGNTENLPEGPF